MIQKLAMKVSDNTLPMTHCSYFLVLGSSYQWKEIKHTNPWFLAITNQHGFVLQKGVHGFPMVGARMFGYEDCKQSKAILYGVIGTQSELLKLREIYSRKPEEAAKIVKELKLSKLRDAMFGAKTLCHSQPVTGPIDILLTKPNTSKVAQSQVAINSAKITRLEKELKQARELQKLLKKLR
jgi:hypothetical protein